MHSILVWKQCSLLSIQQRLIHIMQMAERLHNHLCSWQKTNSVFFFSHLYRTGAEFIYFSVMHSLVLPHLYSLQMNQRSCVCTDEGFSWTGETEKHLRYTQSKTTLLNQPVIFKPTCSYYWVTQPTHCSLTYCKHFSCNVVPRTKYIYFAQHCNIIETMSFSW